MWFLDLYTTTKLFKGNQVSKLPNEVPELNNKLAAMKNLNKRKKQVELARYLSGKAACHNA